MAKDNKIRLPSGMGGLTSYSEETGAIIKLKPGHVIILAAVISIILLLLQMGAL